MLSSKLYLSLGLFVILFSLLFLFVKTSYFSENHAYSQQPELARVENCSNSVKPLAVKIQNDPALNLLGKNFSEIKDIFGEPAWEGSSYQYGPHNYMSYEFNEGIVRFNSPQGLENNLAVRHQGNAAEGGRQYRIVRRTPGDVFPRFSQGLSSHERSTGKQ